jgi:ABC-type cobalamin/Fe3+-siderophores transport system ATPase subunit
MQHITLVTGVSGSGKSSVIDAIRRNPDTSTQVAIGDLDETTPPMAGHVEWLRWRALEQIEAALRQGYDLILGGIIWPHHVIASRQYRRVLEGGVGVRYVMLDREFDEAFGVVEQRMTAEFATVEEVAEQRSINRGQRDQLRQQVLGAAGGAVIAFSADAMTAEQVGQAVLDVHAAAW